MHRPFEDSAGPPGIVPDQMLPVQFAELIQGSSDRTPEHRLMAAVLDDAIRSFCQFAGSRLGREKRLFRETAEWFESCDVSWPFSFESICDALALDPQWIRGLVRRWERAHASVAHGVVKVPCIRRMAGIRHAVRSRAPGLRHLSRIAS
jgi:hypothetical protein